jgi:bacterial/archaeal transporter family-2 protein
MHFVLLFLAFVMGGSLVVQAAVNRNLAANAGGAPLWASMLSALVSAGSLLLFQVAIRSRWPTVAQFNGAPWWVWTGGLLGAFNVLAPVLLVGRLGTALLFAGIITGQLICSLVVDHLGALGLPHYPVTPARNRGIAAADCFQKSVTFRCRSPIVT